jgi:hypothetical protein
VLDEQLLGPDEYVELAPLNVDLHKRRNAKLVGVLVEGYVSTRATDRPPTRCGCARPRDSGRSSHALRDRLPGRPRTKPPNGRSIAP